MRLIAYHKPAQSGATLTAATPETINNRLGVQYKAVEDSAAYDFVGNLVSRGFVCHEFAYDSSYASVINMVKVA